MRLGTRPRGVAGMLAIIYPTKMTWANLSYKKKIPKTYAVYLGAYDDHITRIRRIVHQILNQGRRTHSCHTLEQQGKK